jgi:holo-[acyl-carrier protein] synthase
MIIGIGTDIVDIDRVRSAICKHGERFLNRIFTRDEISFSKKRLLSAESFAKIFAAKEAVIKAISDAHGMSWHDIEVLHEDSGCPCISLKGGALRNIQSRSIAAGGNENLRISVSISDEKNYAIAFVVIETA